MKVKFENGEFVLPGQSRHGSLSERFKSVLSNSRNSIFFLTKLAGREVIFHAEGQFFSKSNSKVIKLKRLSPEDRPTYMVLKCYGVDQEARCTQEYQASQLLKRKNVYSMKTVGEGFGLLRPYYHGYELGVVVDSFITAGVYYPRAYDFSKAFFSNRYQMMGRFLDQAITLLRNNTRVAELAPGKIIVLQSNKGLYPAIIGAADFQLNKTALKSIPEPVVGKAVGQFLSENNSAVKKVLNSITLRGHVLALAAMCVGPVSMIGTLDGQWQLAFDLFRPADSKQALLVRLLWDLYNVGTPSIMAGEITPTPIDSYSKTEFCHWFGTKLAQLATLVKASSVQEYDKEKECVNALKTIHAEHIQDNEAQLSAFITQTEDRLPEKEEVFVEQAKEPETTLLSPINVHSISHQQARISEDYGSEEDLRAIIDAIEKEAESPVPAKENVQPLTVGEAQPAPASADEKSVSANPSILWNSTAKEVNSPSRYKAKRAGHHITNGKAEMDINPAIKRRLEDNDVSIKRMKV